MPCLKRSKHQTYDLQGAQRAQGGQSRTNSRAGRDYRGDEAGGVTTRQPEQISPNETLRSLRSIGISGEPVTDSAVVRGIKGGRVRWYHNVPEDHHVIELRHNGLTGRREVLVDDMSVVRRKFKGRLVGYETFSFGRHDMRHHAIIIIEAVPWTRYCYTLLIDNEPLAQYLANASHANRPLGMAGLDTVQRRNTREMRSAAGQAFQDPVTPLGTYKERRSQTALHFTSLHSEGASPVPDYEEETIMAEQIAQRAEAAAQQTQEAADHARRDLDDALHSGDAPNSTRWSVAD